MHRREGKLIVAATDLVGFLNCGHLTRLDLAAAAGKIRKPDRSEDPEVELLQRRGGMHEKRYVEELRRRGRVITDLSVFKEGSYEEQAERTLDAMRRGDDVIYQGTFFDGKWIGYPDFLLRVSAREDRDAARLSRSVAYSGESDGSVMRLNDSGMKGRSENDAEARSTGLGHDWHYEVADTKLAHSAKASALIRS